MSTAPDMPDDDAPRAELDDELGDDLEPAELVDDDDDDEADDADDEAEAEEAEALGPTPEDLAKLERENTRHERAVSKIMGQAFRYFALCPGCDGLGFSPVPPQASSDVPQDPYLERCERCAGFGAVRTGARAEAMHTVPCPACSGQGYTQKAEQPGVQPMPVAAAGPNGPTAPALARNPEAAAAVDALRAAGYVVVDPPVPAAPIGS